MNIRVCFSKYDRLRFLGHLDVMRYFQHAITRSQIPIAFSNGFHPHMILSFAQPLALSMTSDGEYFDCELTASSADPDHIFGKLQEQMCDGFAIRTVTILPEREPNTRKQTGMSQIAGAMYLCEPLPGCEEILRSEVLTFSERTSCTVQKQGKNSERTVDVRAGIHAIGIIEPSGEVRKLTDDGTFSVPETLSEGWGLERSEHALHRDGAVRFLFAVDAGSENNISTELISAALRSIISEDEDAPETSGKELPERCFSSHRMELYGMKEGHMVSLANL